MGLLRQPERQLSDVIVQRGGGQWIRQGHSRFDSALCVAGYGGAFALARLGVAPARR